MISLLAVIFICSIASFANNLISASAPEVKFDWVRSRCFCGREVLRLRELFPILSYLFLTGKCGRCQVKIPVRYLFVELLIISSGIGLIYKGIPDYRSMISFFIITSLIIIMFTDYLFYTIPNTTIVMLLVLSFFRIFIDGESILYRIIPSITSLMIFINASLYFEKHKKKTLIGMGDIKLIAVLFILYPFTTAIFGIWVSSILGLAGYVLIKNNGKQVDANNRKIPFGFYLALTFIIMELSHAGDLIETFIISIVMP